MPEVAQAVQSRAIRIYRRGSNWVVDSGGRARPEMRFLAPYLPQTSRTITSQAYTVEDALTLGMNPQMLSSALSAWFVEHPNQGNNIVVSEGITELPDNNAFMALGDYIYQMIPVRQVKTGKAVRLMREKVKREVESQRTGLMAQASQEAQNIIDQANVQASRVRLEIAREKSEGANVVKFPLWTRGNAVMDHGNGNLYIRQKAIITFTNVVYKEKVWATKIDVLRSVAVNLWLPMSGDVEQVSLDEARGQLPHITSGSACMKIGEAVQPIVSMDRVGAFRNQIVRTMSSINLASLLSADIREWIPDVVKVLPDEIKKWLERYNDRTMQREETAIAALPPGENVETPQETWSVR